MTNERRQELYEEREKEENLHSLQEHLIELKTFLAAAEANQEALAGLGRKAQADLYQQLIDHTLDEISKTEANIAQLQPAEQEEADEDAPFLESYTDIRKYFQEGEFQKCAEMAASLIMDLVGSCRGCESDCRGLESCIATAIAHIMRHKEVWCLKGGARS